MIIAKIRNKFWQYQIRGKKNDFDFISLFFIFIFITHKQQYAFQFNL